ncbi:hypothetical protein BBP40_011765 [Aspergillus hancockii]|nr:hypothetical protein BBP40_011765 [Aspergillus hancockii]
MTDTALTELTDTDETESLVYLRVLRCSQSGTTIAHLQLNHNVIPVLENNPPQITTIYTLASPNFKVIERQILLLHSTPLSIPSITISGATGNQGGSVAKAITRDPSKPAAIALTQQGAEADLEDRDSLRLAFQNAYAVFAVTNFMEGFNPAAETQQAKNKLDISISSGAVCLSNKKFTGVVHFDGKAVVGENIRSLSIPHTIVRVGLYATVILEYLTPLSTTPPAYGIFVPSPINIETALPLINPSADLGKFIKAILLSPERSIGREFNVAERHYTFAELLDVLKKHDVHVTLQSIDKDTFKAGLASQGLPEFFQEDLAQLLQFWEAFGYYGGGEIEEAKKLVNEPLTSFEESFRSTAVFTGLAKEYEAWHRGKLGFDV